MHSIFTIKQSEYFKNFTILSIGTVVAQAIPMVFYPIIARIFTPSDFGLLATINAIAGVLVVLCTGKYDTMILVAKTTKLAVNLLVVTLLLSLAILLILCVICLIFSTQFANLLNEPYLEKFFYIPFISAFMIIIYQVYNEWCVRNKYFKGLSTNKVVNSSAISLSETIMAYSRFGGGFGLVWGDIIGRSLSALACVVHAVRKDLQCFSIISLKKMMFCLKKYRDCPKFVLPGQLLNTLGGVLPVFMIGAFFSQAEVGFFSMAMMVIGVPSSVVSLAMKDVFRQRANDDYSKSGNCIPLYIKTVKLLFLLSICGFSILFLFSPWLFSLVLGEQWLLAGIYARYLIPMVAISFVSEVMSAMFIVSQRLKQVLYWQILYFLMTIFPLFVGVISKNIFVLIVGLTLCRGAAFVINMIMSYQFAQGK